MKKTMKHLGAFALIMTLALGLIGCGSSQEDVKTIRIGHKNFTEQRIVGQLYAVMVENHSDYETKVTEFGGSQLVLEALKSDEIDLYGDYTGTLYATVLKESGETDTEKVYTMVKDHMQADPYKFEVLGSLGFNNTYTLSVPQEIAEQYNLETISDLAAIGPELRLGGFNEFMERPDGLPGVKEVYGVSFKSEKSLDAGIRYTAIENGDTDVIDAFSTDGKILQYDLKVLKDDKNFFPPYYIVTLLGGNVSTEIPEVTAAINMLEGQISDEEMQQMNFLVDEKGMPERKVAEDFLKEKGLIE